MAYLKIQPIDPALEYMLAQLAKVTKHAGGVDAATNDFVMNTLARPAEEVDPQDQFIALMKLRTTNKG